MAAQPQQMADASCQTDAEVVPPLPLPMQYPANLMYAQSMLAICMGQLQQVELNKAMLQLHLREHQLQADATAARAVALSVLTAADADGFQAGRLAAAVDGHLTEQAADVAPQAAPGPPVAAVPEQPPAQQPDNVRQYRRRMAVAVKITLVMVLLEVRIGWFFVYFFGVFLFIGGCFDPFIEWFQRYTNQQTLEQQLNGLRVRQRRAAELAAGRAAAAAAQQEQDQTADGVVPEGDAGGTDDQVDGADSVEGTQDEGSEGEGLRQRRRSQQPPAADGPAPGSPGETPGATQDDVAANAPVEAEDPNRPPYAHRFFYQLVVMFFMTLIPWWNPDPRYI